MEGLEPPRLSAPDPKSGTATNYATSAAYYAGNATPALQKEADLRLSRGNEPVSPLVAPPEISSKGRPTSSKRRGKFIDNSEIRNTLSLLYEKRTFLS
jgi:hypothetical protein